MEASDEERLLSHHLPPQEQCSQYTCDGTVNIDNEPALMQNTGNWRACFFILGVEFTECLCFFGVSKNLVTYLTGVLQESNIDAAQSVSIWIGSCFFIPLLVAFLADTYWGRYWTVVNSLFVLVIGMLVLTVSASPLFLNASFYNGDISHATVYIGLYLVALGMGCMMPCIPALGADQFDSANLEEQATKGSFFNWYYFAVNMGSLLSTTVLVWVQDNIGWCVCFAIPMLLLGFGFAMFVTGRKVYRYKKLGGSPLTRVFQVVVAAVRNHKMKLPDDSSLLHELPGVTEGDHRTQYTTQFRFFDKAAILPNENCMVQSSPWRLCTVSQVEELKMLLRMFPLWASLLIFFMVTAQMMSTLIEQGVMMDGHVGRFTVPPASLATFDVISVLIWVPIYDAVLVPLARRVTGKDRGISYLQRIGIGLALSTVAMAYSAQVEAWRLAAAALPMNIMWQAPSYLVLGVAEVFTIIGMMEFFYEQSPESMKSLGAALVQLAIAVGNYLNSAMLSMVAAATTLGSGTGWIPDKLDEGHLDYFFWMMAALSVLNLLLFLHCSTRYRGLILTFHLGCVDEGSQYTSDGTVDINNQPALKYSTGNWRACFFILGVEFSEFLAYFGVAMNLVTYLTSVLHESNINAARSVSTWMGCCYFTPLVGAFLADTYWGRYWTIIIFLSIYIIGMLILTVSASLPLLLHLSYNTGTHHVVVYLGLYLVSLGTGGIKPCASALGADQFDVTDPHERVKKSSFFNWYYFSINIGSLLSATVLIWVQDNIGWVVGFAIPTILMSLGFVVFVAGRRLYRYKKPGESPMIRVSQVVVASVRNRHLKLPDDSSILHELSLPSEASFKIQHTSDFRFFDKAAIVATPSDNKGEVAMQTSQWRLCTVSQVEELKMLLRLCPVWVSLVLFFMVNAQMATTFIEQGMVMNNRIGPFVVPPASLSSFDIASNLILIPMYDAILVPLAKRITGNERGISQLQRLGIGVLLSTIAMVYSSLLESKRLAAAKAGNPMNIMWQVPSYFIFGAAEVFLCIGMIELFYDNSPHSMKSLSSALVQLAVAAGNYLNSALLTIVALVTSQSGAPGWIPSNLDEGHLDYYFWMMAAFSSLNLAQVRTMEGSTLLPLLHGTPSQEEHGPCTGNGSVDVKGNPASKRHTGKWRACYSILGGEFCGALAYYAVGTNLVSYLTKVQGQSNVTAASNIASWQGNCYLTTLLGAFLADSYWGRHRTIVVSLTIFTFGMVLLTFSAVIPPNLHASLVISPEALSSLGLYMTALGLGGIWPCVPTFGADQFDDTDSSEKGQKELFYNWYYFAVNGGFFVASTVIVWVQDNLGWGLGFGIPTLFSVIGIVGFLASMRVYRHQKPGGSALTRICQVVVAAFRKIQVDVPSDSSLLYEMPGKDSSIVGSRKLMHTDGLRFVDRAATITASDKASSGEDAPSPWKLCTVTQVEELKILARMLPIFFTAIIFNTAEACFPLFVEQGGAMDNHIAGGKFALPPASLMTFTCVCILILAPSYNKLITLAGVKRIGGFSELHRIGVGMAFAVLALAAAASVETARLRSPAMSIMWQAAQYGLVGVAKVFSVVGYIEFAYEQSPDAMRSLCQACSLIMVTLGSYLVSALLTIVSGWIPEDLNEGHLDRFFWLMAVLQFLNLIAFVCCATRIKQDSKQQEMDQLMPRGILHSRTLPAAGEHALAFFGIQYNLVTFLTTQLHQKNSEAARNYTMWQGTCYIAPLAGAILADSCLGRFRTIVTFFSIYIIGMGTMTLSAASPAAISRSIQPAVFSVGLYLMAIGSGCIKSCVGPFGADQFDGGDAAERVKKSSYFNWFYFAMYVGGLVSATATVYLQDNIGWLIGFAVPSFCTLLAIASFLLGTDVYRYQHPRGSPLVRAFKVLVAAVRKRHVGGEDQQLVLYDDPSAEKRLQHTDQFRFLDKAAAVAVDGGESTCTVTQVEEVKSIVRMLPVWATGIVYCMVLVQQSLFLVQGRSMRRRLTHSFSIPPASLNAIYAVAVLLLVPLYDRAVVPIARRLITGTDRGLSELQRIGAGLLLSVAAMAAAAFVEERRLHAAGEMSIVWQVPQYTLLGASAVFAYVGQLEFFYNQAPDSMRSLCSALGHMTWSLGSYLSTIIVTVVSAVTARGGSPGWIADEINDGHLDRFFWLVAGLSSVNFVVFLFCARRYKDKNQISS
uniref:Uncharacterized protein n=1 Tax=Leersia perrieri TaxID=77586 RepID=A0A0D9XH88_9ORYZ